MFDLNKSIAINSKKEIFVFQLSQNGEIIYDIYDSSLKPLDSNNLNQKNVLRYSIFCDESDAFHLVALINTGELKYYKYIEQKWSMSTIAKFDIKSNIYNQFQLMMINNKLHIMYNYSNLINSNIWTIQHVILGNEVEEGHNAIRYIAKKVPEPFIVDVDSQGTIHLLYKTNLNNNSQIYHSFYSPYTKAWSTLPKQISSDNINNLFPFLFIDLQNNLHGLWLEEEKDRYQIKYSRMSSTGKEKYIWKEINLPYIPISQFPPIIFEEDKNLRLLYISNNTMQSLISTDYGNSWIDSQFSNSITENICIAKVASNLLPKTNKINYCYCNLYDSFKLYFLNNYLYNEPLSTYNEYSIESDNNPIPESPETKTELINELTNKIDLILDTNNSLESIMIKILSNQANIKNKLDSIEDSIKSHKQSFFARFFNSSK